MNHHKCPDCGVVIANRSGVGAERPCPRCLLHHGVFVRMELRALESPYASYASGGPYQRRGH